MHIQHKPSEQDANNLRYDVSVKVAFVVSCHAAWFMWSESCGVKVAHLSSLDNRTTHRPAILAFPML